MLTLLQQSWADKMVERVRNVIKRDSKKSKASPSEEAPEPKRRRKGTDLLRRYPVNSNAPTDSNENAETLELLSMQSLLKQSQEIVSYYRF